MANDTGGNPQVDFVWGNMPPQPDTQRVTSPTKDAYGAISSAKINAALDNHTLVTKNWSGYPGLVPAVGFSVAVPDLAGMTEAAAQAALTTAKLKWKVLAVTTAGATALNDTNVASQSPAAAAGAYEQQVVSYSLYHYIA